MKLNYLLLDPNDVDRIQARQRLKEITSLDLIKEFSNFNDLNNFLKYENADLILIDPTDSEDKIFNYIQQYGIQNQVILTSKKSTHAVKGFELGILDFLPKPFNIDRFKTTLDRFSSSSQNTLSLNQELQKRIEVKCNLKIEKIVLASIQWIEAMGDYVKIVTPKKKFIVLSSMKSIQERLPKLHFFRCHKSYIINLEEVSNYSQTTIFLKKKSIPLSRNKKKEFKVTWANRY